jgi:hypothetical protein
MKHQPFNFRRRNFELSWSHVEERNFDPQEWRAQIIHSNLTADARIHPFEQTAIFLVVIAT